MGVIEIICFAAVMALIVFFVARICVEMAKFLYNMAPIVVPLLFIAILLYMTENLNLNFNKETEVKHADHIGSVKN